MTKSFSVFRLSAMLALIAAAGCASVTTARPAAEVAAKPAAASRAPAFLEANIIGQDGAALDKLFGPAALIRREGEGEFRRYTLASCTLIAILYPDEAGKSAVRRLDAAAKTSAEPPADLGDCLAAGLAAPVS